MDYLTNCSVVSNSQPCHAPFAYYLTVAFVARKTIDFFRVKEIEKKKKITFYNQQTRKAQREPHIYRELVPG